jgi:hypothetical protein
MRRTVKFAVATVAVAIVALGMRVYWTEAGRYQYTLAKESISHSAPVRVFRCRGTARPRLVSGPQNWSLSYSWVGGMGEGDVWLNLDANGTAVLRAVGHSAEETNSTFRLSAEQVSRIAAAIDTSGLLCLDPLPRNGYVVHDLGRFTVRVTAPSYAKTVYIDDCTTIRDTRALGQVIHEIASLEPLLGKPIAWGPFGTYAGRGSCGARSNNQER